MARNSANTDDRVNRLAFDAATSTIPARFQKVAAQHPSRVAIGSGAWQPTYAELHGASNSLANTFEASCAQDGRVALLQGVNGFLIGSILGGLIARRPVAVFNPSDPLPRLRQKPRDADPA